MGLYINPAIGKEQWLEKYATKEEKLPTTWEGTPKDYIFLVWVDNGPFTAVLVVDGKVEIDYMNTQLKIEPRPYQIYRATRNDVRAVLAKSGDRLTSDT